jgi:hypothetical protein
VKKIANIFCHWKFDIIHNSNLTIIESKFYDEILNNLYENGLTLGPMAQVKTLRPLASKKKN